MEQTTTYQFSGEALAEAKQRILLMQLFVPIALIIFTLMSPVLGDNLSIKLTVLVISLIVIEGLLIIQPALMLGKMNGLTLTLSSESIERTSGKFVERISYTDISRVDVNEKPSGKLAYIKVQAALKKTIYVQGFESMEMIVQHLERSVTDKSLIRRKRQAVDWNSPRVQITIGTLTVAVILLIQGLGKTSYHVFNALFFFAIASLSLIFKPITRSAGKRFEKFEIFTSVVLLICAMIMAVLLLFFRP